MLTYDPHEQQVLCALVLRLIVQVRDRQNQPRILTANTQFLILAYHFLPRALNNWCEASVKIFHSTTSCPIFEYSLSMPAGRGASEGQPRRSNANDMAALHLWQL